MRVCVRERGRERERERKCVSVSRSNLPIYLHIQTYTRASARAHTQMNVYTCTRVYAKVRLHVWKVACMSRHVIFSAYIGMRTS